MLLEVEFLSLLLSCVRQIVEIVARERRRGPQQKCLRGPGVGAKFKFVQTETISEPSQADEAPERLQAPRGPGDPRGPKRPVGAPELARAKHYVYSHFRDTVAKTLQIPYVLC